MFGFLVTGVLLHFFSWQSIFYMFAAGALLAGIWLVLTPALLGRLCPPSVFAIAARIFGLPQST